MKMASLFLISVLLLMPSGCGQKSGGRQSARGAVWFRGERLPGGVILFVPDADRGNNGPLARSPIAADGTFALAPETAPGWYRVVIAPLAGEMTELPTVSNPYPGPPSRYRNPALSGLQAEIKPGADNVFEFHLEDT